ncbi:uncharacterized protein H6S33_000914 [Morchella sextelata]|uniref:uncharacterized protein n=1 Tax=Morchella sextelata TaxID=1174677 RepID=UPI001D04D3B2|nr:uncharacterized protein H6S33_000914 [Morchella sextelata]KAH0615278.1 hypothetical protein H6S33_000914 [Morchella sextelata]
MWRYPRTLGVQSPPRHLHHQQQQQQVNSPHSPAPPSSRTTNLHDHDHDHDHEDMSPQKNTRSMSPASLAMPPPPPPKPKSVTMEEAPSLHHKTSSKPVMTPPEAYANYRHFNVTIPAPGVAHVEINRPEKLNAFYKLMWDEYGSIFDRLSGDSAVRCIVLSGAGEKAFTAGLDLEMNMEMVGGRAKGDDEAPIDPARKAWALRKHIQEFQEAISAAERCDKPVISVLHGFSLGLAIDIACATDIRICASSTTFAVKEVDIGLAADIGTLSRLPKVVGSLSWVKDVTMTARFFGAEEALRVGLVSAVYGSKKEALEAAMRLGITLAGKSPVAVQSTKALVNYSVGRSVQEGLLYTQSWNAAALQTQDVPNAIKATMQRKKPTFSKL